MALDKNTLKTKIEHAFKKAKETPPSSNPDDSGNVQEQILVLCQTEFEVFSSGLSRPHSNHRRLKAGLNPHHFHRDEPLAQLAVDLFNAIDAFVKTGDVVGISVAVKDLSNNPIGAGAQTGTGKMQ
jgi:hypothetical protein